MTLVIIFGLLIVLMFLPDLLFERRERRFRA